MSHYGALVCERDESCVSACEHGTGAHLEQGVERQHEGDGLGGAARLDLTASYNLMLMEV